MSVTATIDPTKSWVKVEERVATESDPISRRNLEVVVEHMKGEVYRDLARIMATVSDNPSYHNYGMPPEASPEGIAAVRTFYENFVTSGVCVEMNLDRLVVDRDCVVTEGLLRIACPGRALGVRGIVVDDPDAYYLYEARQATLWPFDGEGKVLGEDTYFASDGFAGIASRKLRGVHVGRPKE